MFQVLAVFFVPLVYITPSVGVAHASFQLYSTPWEEWSLWLLLKAALTVVVSIVLAYFVVVWVGPAALFVCIIYSNLAARAGVSLWIVWKAALSFVLAPFAWVYLGPLALGIFYSLALNDPLLLIIVALGQLLVSWWAEELPHWSRLRARASQLARITLALKRFELPLQGRQPGMQRSPKTKPRRKKRGNPWSSEPVRSAAKTVRNKNSPLERNWSIYAIVFISLAIAMNIIIALWFMQWGAVDPPAPAPAPAPPPPMPKWGRLHMLGNLFGGRRRMN